MGKSIINISVSLVMFCNDIDELTKAIKSTLQSKLVSKIYLIDNSPTDDLKELKELLDLELITQEEFDKKSKELKKIILGN